MQEGQGAIQKKKHLPAAIEQLVVQGLSSSAAIALVTKVVNDFGMRGISEKSQAFLWLASDFAETRVLSKTGKTVKQLKMACDVQISKAFEGIHLWVHSNCKQANLSLDPSRRGLASQQTSDRYTLASCTGGLTALCPGKQNRSYSCFRMAVLRRSPRLSSLRS